MGEYQGPEGRVVEVAVFRTDTRYRLVWLLGVGWMPVCREAFEATVHQLFPGLDLDDPHRVHWADRPWQWPR